MYLLRFLILKKNGAITPKTVAEMAKMKKAVRDYREDLVGEAIEKADDAVPHAYDSRLGAWFDILPKGFAMVVANPRGEAKLATDYEGNWEPVAQFSNIKEAEKFLEEFAPVFKEMMEKLLLEEIRKDPWGFSDYYLAQVGNFGE